MNTWKWIQLVCMSIVWLMSPAFQIRNVKLNDPAKKGHNRLFWGLVTIWMFAGAMLALATWKDFTRKEKAPAWEVVVNKLPISPTNMITLPNGTNGQTLLIRVMNVGSWPAVNPSISVHFVNGVTVTKADGWTPGIVVMRPDAPIKDGEEAFYSVQPDSHLIATAPDNGFFCPALTVRSPYVLYAVQIAVSANNLPTTTNTVLIHASQSAQQPYLGF